MNAVTYYLLPSASVCLAMRNLHWCPLNHLQFLQITLTSTYLRLLVLPGHLLNRSALMPCTVCKQKKRSGRFGIKKSKAYTVRKNLANRRKRTKKGQFARTTKYQWVSACDL